MKAVYFENHLLRILLAKLILRFNKNAVLGSFSPIRFTEVAEPSMPNQSWLKVKNKTCGLCGSDIHMIFMEIDPRCFPAAVPSVSKKYLGHELLSKVVEVGSDVHGLKKDDRVVLRIDWPSCFQMEFTPPCRQCNAGNYMLCENLGKVNLPTLDTGGGFSPFMIMHKSQPHRISDAIDDDEAPLIEPTACAVHGVLKKKPEKGQSVLVIGCGTIGLLTIAVAKAFEPNARVYALAKYRFQADAAMKIGADEIIFSDKDIYKKIAKITKAEYFQGHLGNEILLGGFDIIYDSIGNDSSIKDALRFAKAGGHVVILGVNLRPGKFDYTPIWYQEVHLLGTNSHATEADTNTTFEIASRLIAEKKVNLDGLITHRFTLEEFKDAVKTFINKKESKAIKIVIDH